MAGTWFLIALVAVASVVVAQAATNHVVGGTIGWRVPPSATVYSQWASTQTFAVGDTLTFNFATGTHNVIEVPKASFDACTAKNQIGRNLTTGPATITLTSPGMHYYICGFPSHCSLGQKLDISVGSAGSGSSSGPAASPGGPPSNAAPSSLISSDYLRNSAVAALLSATAAFLM